MAIQRDGRGVISVSGSGASWVDTAEYYGSWWGEEPGIFLELWCSILRDGIPYTAASELSGTVGSTISDGGTWTNYLSVAADDSYAYRVNARRDGVVQNSNMKGFKAYAGPVAFQSLAVSNPQQTSIDFTGQFRPTTLDSVAVAYLQYKKTTDVTWLNFSNSGNKQGYGWETLAGTVTGLEAGTSYQFRIYVTRNTENDTTATSSTISLSTLASTPVVTTEDASSVSATSATLNGTIDANSLPGGVDVNFQWNTQAYRRVTYNDAVNITPGSVLTVGTEVYHFKENAVAVGDYSYAGQPDPLDFVDIEGDTYTFREPTVAGGELAYDNGTLPTDGKIVTIPSISPEPDAVYKFIIDVKSSGGKIESDSMTQPGAGTTVTIPAFGGDPDAVYTFVATVAAAGDVDLGATVDDTMLNLARCINKSGGTEGAGQDYMAFDFGSGAAAHPLFSAMASSGDVFLTTLEFGAKGNVTLSADLLANLTLTSPTGGVGVADPGDVRIGTDADDTMLNLTRAINNLGGTSGVDEDYIAFDFGAGPAEHSLLEGTLDTGADILYLDALNPGTAGNVTVTTDEASITVTSPFGGDDVENPGDVLIGADADATFLNLTRAINNSGGTPGVGADYLPVGGAASQYVSAVHDSGSDVVDLTALEAGAAGNDITLTKSGANISVNVMAGGADLENTDDYEVLIGADADETMLNLARAVNNSGGTPGINYNVIAAHTYCVASRRAVDDYVSLAIETNINPAQTFTTDEPTFTLTSDLENAWANETVAANYANDGTTQFSRTFVQEAVTLEMERTYFFRAKAVYTANGGGTLYGDEFSFTTAGLPGPLAIEEEHMQTIQFDGQYGTAKTVTFTLREASGVSSDLFYTGAAPLQADCKIFKDGVYDDTSDNAAARVLSGATAIYTLLLSAAEMQAETIDLVIHDASGSAFRDAHIQVRTAQRLSEIDVDATNGPTNASAVTAIGNGTGHGIFATSAGSGADINAILSSMWLRVANAQAGAGGNEIKLDAGAEPTDDYYNGCVVYLLSGTGAGQARVITAYTGGVRTATVDTAWNTNPDATTLYGLGGGSRPWALAPAEELQIGEMPGPTASYGEMMQLLFQRFAFKVEQTASAQTWYNSSGDPLFDRSVSDDGVVQTIEALADV